jgi:hypothetical protein
VKDVTMTRSDIFDELKDVLSDMDAACRIEQEPAYDRLATVLNEPPLSNLLRDLLPVVDLDRWLAENKSTGAIGGSPLRWPSRRAEDVALRVGLCKAAGEGKLDALSFTVAHFPRSTSRISDYHEAFIATIVRPMVRDLARLVNAHPFPEHVLTAFEKIPRSGDADLDALIERGTRRIQEASPDSRREAVEALWDAWERLKSIEHADKKTSAQLLVGLVGTGSPMHALIEQEATALTKVGNDFRIRHSETNRHPVEDPLYYDYLFGRLFALVNLLLHLRVRKL